MIYPGIVVVCWMPTLTKNTLISMGITLPFAVGRISIVLSQLQGFLDAVVYGSQSIRMISCKKRRSAVETNIEQPADLYLSALRDSSNSLLKSQRVQINFSRTPESADSDIDESDVEEITFAHAKRI